MQSNNISGPLPNPFEKLKQKLGENYFYKLPLLNDPRLGIQIFFISL
jgi:hypothetical protein